MKRLDLRKTKGMVNKYGLRGDKSVIMVKSQE